MLADKSDAGSAILRLGHPSADVHGPPTNRLLISGVRLRRPASSPKSSVFKVRPAASCLRLCHVPLLKPADCSSGGLPGGPQPQVGSKKSVADDSRLLKAPDLVFHTQLTFDLGPSAFSGGDALWRPPGHYACARCCPVS